MSCAQGHRLVLAALLWGAGAGVGWAQSAPDSSPTQCAQTVWRLDGAPLSADGGDASFNEAWRSTLSEISDCVGDRDCVEVQGRFDARTFFSAVVRAMGSREAAQLLRARGRAQRVIAALYDQGVPADRLREIPPPNSPTYRGVRVSLVQGCRPPPAPPPAPVEAAPAPAPAPVVAPATPSRAPTPRAARPAPAPPTSPGPFWLEAGSDLSLMLLDPENVFAPVLRVGAGYRRSWIYARVDAGLSLANVPEQRTAFEAVGALGFAPLSWLEIGALGGHRIGSSSPTRPWLQQAWFLGVEATQCIWSPTPRTRLCIQESVLPFGQALRRGEVAGDTITRIQPEQDRLIRFGLALTLRAWL